MSEGFHRVRFAFVAVVFCAAFGTVGWKLTYLHLAYRQDATPEAAVELPAMRGRILDRNGRVLAVDTPRFHLVADPQAVNEAGHVEVLAGLFGRLFQCDAVAFEEMLRQPASRYQRLRKWISLEEADRIRAMKLPAREVWLEPAPRRHYPLEELAAHVIGFVNAERQAGGGIELALDRWLRGRDGLRKVIRGRRLGEIADRRPLDIPPEEGATVELTLDADLQAMVEAALDEAVRQHSALGAWAVMVDVRTGEILAMASRPSFDPNRYNEAATDALMNRAASYTYEPGSIFKAVTMAAALEADIVRPDTVLDCEHGLWHYRGRPLRDFHPYGRLTVAGVIQKSSNIGAAKCAVALGEARLEQCLRDFGFGRRLCEDLSGEASGIVPPRHQWDPLTPTRIAMGHSIGVTSLQMVMALAAIGNRGVRMRPALVRRVADARGRTVRQFAPVAEGQPVCEATARTMCALLAGVTQPEGTGRRAAFPGYRVAGKTGTADKPCVGGYDSHRNIASFMGLVPAENPVFALLVSVDEPQPEHTGGVVAAPVFRRIAEEAVRYLRIPAGDLLPHAVPLRAEEGPDDADWAVM